MRLPDNPVFWLLSKLWRGWAIKNRVHPVKLGPRNWWKWSGSSCGSSRDAASIVSDSTVARFVRHAPGDYLGREPTAKCKKT